MRPITLQSHFSLTQQSLKTLHIGFQEPDPQDNGLPNPLQEKVCG